MRAPGTLPAMPIGFTKIPRLDQKISRDLFAGFDEGAVSHQRLAFMHPHDDRRGCRVQRRRMDVLSRGMQLVRQLDGFGEELRLRLLVHFLEGVFVMMHDQHELHRVTPGMMAAGCYAHPFSLSGRTSMLPYWDAGNFDAIRTASLRSLTSINR